MPMESPLNHKTYMCVRERMCVCVCVRVCVRACVVCMLVCECVGVCVVYEDTKCIMTWV